MHVSGRMRCVFGGAARSSKPCRHTHIYIYIAFNYGCGYGGTLHAHVAAMPTSYLPFAEPFLIIMYKWHQHIPGHEPI
jgi:hypothetical protein